LALGRNLPRRIKATSWGKSDAFSFYDRNILIIGAGGIAEELISLLKPFRAKVTVVRNNSKVAVAGATRTAGLEQLDDLIAESDLVIIACALTEKTRGMFDYRRFQQFKKGSYLVNIARGPIVVSDDLLRALDEQLLAGAGTDVTDPEPLPEGHSFFGRTDLIVTPHTADTKEIVTGLFAKRVFHNVKAYLGQGQYLGLVDKDLGY
jgi:phosphoglycerate dehydrogenase-like enzyme